VITATVLALRGDSGAARRHAGRALAAIDPAECGLVAARARRALGVAALADGSYLQAFTQLRGLFGEDGTPLHNYASYLGVADLAAAAVRADRRMEGCDVIEQALSRLEGRASARLFLSPRTVSSHLYRSFPKLGVASRHELRDVITRASPPATAHESTGSRTLR
jgi:hypothetical protein